MRNLRAPAQKSPPDVSRQAWQTICEQLEAPDLELTISNFAVLLANVHKCRQAGMKFDRAFIALLNVLKRETFGSDADTDDDASVDDGHEYDDASESNGAPMNGGR